MKKYEPAITVVSLTLLFAVLALLVTGAFIRQPEPQEGMVREKDDEMQIYNGRDWIDVFEQPKPAAFDEPNEPNEVVDGAYSYVADVNAYFFKFEPCTQISISCENGNKVVIDYGGDEVVVTGANEEGAKIFFEYVKKYMDAYLEAKE